ncbi:MAG TPA: CBS domain-containing protein [Actinomycetes bacterium]|jgi:CBS domain-containing protein|nr:CBS domain-containing protein [Actinomycetes bacterium]
MIVRRVRDVMTQDVVTITEQEPFVEIVRLMAVHKVSALPVVDGAGRVVGIVSEADLLRKEEYQDEQNGQHLLEGRRRRAARAKAAGRTAGELMSVPVVTIRAEATVPTAAKLLAQHGIKRLPVVDETGRLVGVVSRADLLRLFLRPDEEIRREILDEVLLQSMWIDPSTVTVAVHDGIVTLAGRLERKSLVPMVVHLTRRVPGVVDVIGRLTFELDDDRLETPRSRSWVP